MDLNSLHYFSELAKDLHFTKTAQRLYISQQTLSNHIKRLEEELGEPLFERRPALALTCAGEHVLSFAQVMRKESINLQGILSDISEQERGLLSVGASMPRGNTFLPRVLPDFYREYPKVEIRVVDGISSKLERMVEEGELDFAVVLAEEASRDLMIYRLLEDPVCLCVPDALLRQYYGEEAADIKARSIQGARVQDFARLPFCMLSNRLGGQVRRCFEEADCQVQTCISATYSYLSVSLCSQGLGACFTTRMNLLGQLRDFGDQVNIFPLLYRGSPMSQELSLIHHKGRYMPRYAQRFLELVTQYFEAMERVELTRLV